MVRRLHRWRLVNVNHHEFGVAVLLCPRDMSHQVDLGRDRVAAPDNDQVRFSDLARIIAVLHAMPGVPTESGKVVQIVECWRDVP